MELKTNIIEIGSMVPAFEEEMLVVLFDPTAPAELRDISVIHEVDENDKGYEIKVGSKFTIGANEYEVTEVGSLANANFDELGHLSIYFKEDNEEAVLPGAISAKPAVFPEFEIGATIKFFD